MDSLNCENLNYKHLAANLRQLADRLENSSLTPEDQTFVDKVLTSPSPSPSDREPSDDEVLSYLFLGWFIYKLIGK